MSSGGRRHNGSHNGHHGSGAGTTAVEHNGHHPPREPRKEESTLVRRSFRRCGDEWRADSRRCVSRRLTIVCAAFFFLSLSRRSYAIKRVADCANENGKCLTEPRREDPLSQKFDVARHSGFFFVAETRGGCRRSLRTRKNDNNYDNNYNNNYDK